jgi:glucose-1-phosphate cytidylyltransferase
VSTQQLAAFHHEGFWQPMDTLREKEDLERLASLGDPPWMKIEKYPLSHFHKFLVLPSISLYYFHKNFILFVIL